MHLFQQKKAGQELNGTFLVESQSDASIIPTKKQEDPVPEKQSTKAWMLAVFLLFAYVALTAGAAQLSSLAFQEQNFKAPFLFVLFKTAFRSLAFPIYIIVNTIVKLAAGRKLDFPRTWRRCLRVCGEDGLTWRVVLFKLFPPMFFNVLVQIGYTLALKNLSTSLASALTPPTLAISYVMSWFFLKNPMMLVKICFVMVCFAGVTVIVEDQLNAKYTTEVLVGIICMLAQDLCLACYQLLFKKAFPKGDLGQVSFAISGMYVLMFFFYLPVPIILNQVGYEVYDLTEFPYPLLVGSWMCSAVSSLVYGYGLVAAGGFFMSLSELLILATNSGIDGIFRDVVISQAQVIGTVIVGLAFLVLVLPDRYISVKLKKRLKSCRTKLMDLCRGHRERKNTVSLAKPDSQTTLELTRSSSEDSSLESPKLGGYATDASLDSSAIGEEDVLENKDLHIAGDETRLPN